MRILVVDDEVELAEAVARGLRREGNAVDTFVSIFDDPSNGSMATAKHPDCDSSTTSSCSSDA